MSQKFRLKSIKEKVIVIKEIDQNDLMSKKHKRFLQF